MDTVEGENRLFFIEITMSRKNTSIEYKKTYRMGIVSKTAELTECMQNKQRTKNTHIKCKCPYFYRTF